MSRVDCGGLEFANDKSAVGAGVGHDGLELGCVVGADDGLVEGDVVGC